MAAAPYDAISYVARLSNPAPLIVAAGAATAKLLPPVQKYVVFMKFYSQDANLSPGQPVNGSISGTVTELGAAVARCLVRLYFRPTGALVKTALTSAAGAYTFAGLDPAEAGNFTVVVLDPTGGVSYNAIVLDKLTPV